jgi:hypothetical protein
LAIFLIAVELAALGDWNRAENILTLHAALATNSLQQEEWNQVFFEEIPGAGTIGLVTAAIPAMELYESPGPSRVRCASQFLPPDQGVPNPGECKILQ